ncbi:MAG: hypothetical protein GY856_37205, partial [bacterium]|nr:hypothetical protein [bacterium]
VTLTVISTGDSGAGTLRDALEQANTDGVPTVIVFDPLPAGSTISPLSPLPPLLEGNTTIDADLDDDDCIPDIELDGSLAGWSFGLEIYSSDNLVHGLVINRFEADGIFLGRGAHGNVVECNYIGTDFSGTSPAPNLAQGVVVTDSDNRIGPGNVIAFNDGSGVLVEDVSADAYPGFAGLTPDYADVFPVMDLTNDCAGAFHSADGITPLDGSGMPFIDNFGARFTGTLNVSGGDYTFNLPWLSFTGRLLIDGDVVMVCDEWSESCPAVVPLPAGDHDVEVDLIVYSGYAGLVLEISGPGTPTLSTGGEPGLLGELFQLRQPSERNRITQNSIFDNGRLGISLGPCHPSISDPGDFDIGPNTRLNFPELTGFIDHDDGTFTVDGTAAAESTVELFASAPDPLGHGEGKEYLTSVVATGGTFSALITFPPGYYAV